MRFIPITIKGYVFDDLGQPFPNVNVYEADNSENGVSTDFEGYFELQVPNDAEFIVSSVGYVSHKLKPKTTEFKIFMSEDVNNLDAVNLGTIKTKKSINPFLFIALGVLIFINILISLFKK